MTQNSNKTIFLIVNGNGERLIELIAPTPETGTPIALTVTGMPGVTAQIAGAEAAGEADEPRYASWVGWTLLITVDDMPECPAMRIMLPHTFELLNLYNKIELEFRKNDCSKDATASPAPEISAEGLKGMPITQ